MVSILTEHCALNGHLLIMRKRGLSDCDRCGLEEMTEYFVALPCTVRFWVERAHEG